MVSMGWVSPDGQGDETWTAPGRQGLLTVIGEATLFVNSPVTARYDRDVAKPWHTHLSPPSLATQMANSQCTVGQIRPTQPILSWSDWEMDAPLRALELHTFFSWVPHKLLAPTLTMKKPHHSQQSICGMSPATEGLVTGLTVRKIMDGHS